MWDSKPDPLVVVAWQLANSQRPWECFSIATADVDPVPAISVCCVWGPTSVKHESILMCRCLNPTFPVYWPWVLPLVDCPLFHAYFCREQHVLCLALPVLSIKWFFLFKGSWQGPGHSVSLSSCCRWRLFPETVLSIKFAFWGGILCFCEMVNEFTLIEKVIEASFVCHGLGVIMHIELLIMLLAISGHHRKCRTMERYLAQLPVYMTSQVSSIWWPCMEFLHVKVTANHCYARWMLCITFIIFDH